VSDLFRRKRRYGSCALAAATLSILFTRDRVRGATATWLGTTDANWTTETDWSPATYPGSIGTSENFDTAIFNNAGLGNTSVTLPSDLNLSNILFDTSAAAAYTLTGGSLLGTSGGAISMTSTVVNPQIISSSLSIESGFDGTADFSLVNDATSTAATMTYSGNIGNSGDAYTLTLDGSNTGNNQLTGIVSGALIASGGPSLLKTGSGTWNLAGTEDYAGSTQVDSGNLLISGTYAAQQGVFVSGGQAQLTGTMDSFFGLSGGNVLIDQGGHFAAGEPNTSGSGTLTIDNTTTLMNDRFNGSGLYLAGLTLNYLSGVGNNSESIGVIYSEYGANAIDLTPNAGGSTVITANTLDYSTDAPHGFFTPVPSSTILLTGTNLGGTPGANTTNFICDNATAPIGGGGSPGTNDISIENFMAGRDLSLSGNAQYGFVTNLTGANGARLLNPSTEYATTISDAIDTGGALRNVSLTSAATVNGSATTINALRLDTNGSVNGAGTLTVNSGAILALPGNGGISVANLNFGSQHGIFTTIGDLSISGAISGSEGITKSGAGTLSLAPSATLQYSGDTYVTQGVIKIAANNQLPVNETLFMDGGALDLDGFNQTITNLAFETSTPSFIYNSDSSSQATLTITNQELNGASPALGGPGGNNFGVTIDTRVTFGGANTYTGPTTVLGGMELYYYGPQAPASNIISSSSHLNLGGYMEILIDQNSYSQTFNGMTINPGASIVVGWGNIPGSIAVNFGAISRNVGGALSLPGYVSTFSTTNSNTNGILGGYLVYNETDWAAAGASGIISATTDYTNDTWSSGANVTVTQSSTQSNATANSLRFAYYATNIVTLSGTNVLTSGGVLVSANVGPNLSQISGGTLEGSAGGDLILNQWNDEGNLEIDSTIANNGSATALTVAGVGSVVLTGTNTFTGGTYISRGILCISSNANLGLPSAGAPINFNFGTLVADSTLSLDNGGADPRPIILGNNGGTLSALTGQTLTASGAISGALGQLSISGPGSVVLASANTFGGGVNISSGTLVVARPGAIPAGSTVTNNSSLVVNANITAASISGIGSVTVAPSVVLNTGAFSQTAGLINNGTTNIDGTGTVGPISGNGTLNVGSISSPATLTIASNSGLCQQSAISVAVGSQLDIENNHLIIDYGSGPDPISSIAALLASGYAGGFWNGTGIMSFTATANSTSYGLGYADSADPGNPANLSSGTLEIKYTLLGDANLDGVVNGIDFGILAANFNKGVSRWDQGDFNYDNVVNGIDFGELAANFNKGASGTSIGPGPLSDPALVAFAEANGLMADVPEPASFGLVGTAMLATLSRRRRRAPRRDVPSKNA
jgi:fibronectin-binding autotransporter adhesin